MTVTITLTLAGSDTGPFNLYSNVDGYTTAIVTGVDRNTLTSGYNITAPDGTTEILVRSTGVCHRDLYLAVAGAPVTTTTTTSSTSSTSTTSTSTTLNPDAYYLAQIGRYAKTDDGCPLNVVLRIFLDASDYALFVANGYSFAGLGGGAPTTCTAIARNVIGTPISALLFDQENISWKLTSGNFNYYEFQC
jgi:hypothetical protein